MRVQFLDMLEGQGDIMDESNDLSREPSQPSLGETPVEEPIGEEKKTNLLANHLNGVGLPFPKFFLSEENLFATAAFLRAARWSVRPPWQSSC